MKTEWRGWAQLRFPYHQQLCTGQWCPAWKWFQPPWLKSGDRPPAFPPGRASCCHPSPPASARARHAPPRRETWRGNRSTVLLSWWLSQRRDRRWRHLTHDRVGHAGAWNTCYKYNLMSGRLCTHSNTLSQTHAHTHTRMRTHRKILTIQNSCISLSPSNGYRDIRNIIIRIHTHSSVEAAHTCLHYTLGVWDQTPATRRTPEVDRAFWTSFLPTRGSPCSRKESDVCTVVLLYMFTSCHLKLKLTMSTRGLHGHQGVDCGDNSVLFVYFSRILTISRQDSNV